MPLMRSVAVAAAGLAGVLLSGGCWPSAPPPSDDVLRTRFTEQRETFEALLALVRDNPTLQTRGTFVLMSSDFQNAGFDATTLERVRRLCASIGVEMIEQQQAGAGQVTFVTWLGDIPGPGFHAKGVAYSETEPSGTPRQSGGMAFTEYRPLSGRWYIYEHLID